jgi:hypothetical protein
VEEEIVSSTGDLGVAWELDAALRNREKLRVFKLGGEVTSSEVGRGGRVVVSLYADHATTTIGCFTRTHSP